MDASRSEVKFTYQDYLLLPEEKQYELIDGELSRVPAPRPYHQIVAGQIETALRLFVDENEMGKVIGAPCDVYLSPHDVVQPDVLFISSERLGIIKEEYVGGAPDLVVEVLSPSSEDRDRRLKHKLYSLHGAREYWIVDPDGKSIEVFCRKEAALVLHRTFAGEEHLESPLLTGLSVSLGALFKF